LDVTITDGSVDFTAGSNPCVITVFINPIGDSDDVRNTPVKSPNWYGQTNPANPNRGFCGRHLMRLDTDGTTVNIIRSIGWEFIGYMGSSGEIILALDGKSQLKRSINEGESFSNFGSSFNGGIAGRNSPMALASGHDSQRAWVGLNNGTLVKVQNGVNTTVFSFDEWCTYNSVSGDWPGAAIVNGRRVPAVSGIAESFYDPNLLYICFYLFGAPYNMFQTRNALSAKPTWTCITSPDGLMGPIQGMTIHPITDEPVFRSSHGITWFKPDADHLANYNITKSIIDDLKNSSAGPLYIATPV
jgi:hypothetical protein